MPLEPYDETEVYTVGWEPELDAAVLEWHTTPEAESFRAGQEALLSLVEDRRATKVLADCRAFESFPDQREWLLEDWAPRLFATSVEYGAYIYPEDRIAQFELDKTARRDTEVPLEQLFAEDMSEARAWLHTK
ncbi:hypothetical protein [Halorientalis regularis]|jgi:hypothetical protein|uniref:SpoIIAA-like n=1 Tax=Halorientalis regularis TaxID=660518 RepID=A0A1G7M640_9EURY|nr:hypothetical protein [Halorientalis regularis]SDF57233.1 hypothetical protein SAMN05216218_107149 [Halorientalis regularis]